MHLIYIICEPINIKLFMSFVRFFFKCQQVQVVSDLEDRVGDWIGVAVSLPLGLSHASEDVDEATHGHGSSNLI